MTKKEEKGLSTFEGTLSMMSTSVGAGFVAIPYGVYNLGFYWALFTLVVVAIITRVSIELMLEAQLNLKKI